MLPVNEVCSDGLEELCNKRVTVANMRFTQGRNEGSKEAQYPVRQVPTMSQVLPSIQ